MSDHPRSDWSKTSAFVVQRSFTISITECCALYDKCNDETNLDCIEILIKLLAATYNCLLKARYCIFCGFMAVLKKLEILGEHEKMLEKLHDFFNRLIYQENGNVMRSTNKGKGKVTSFIVGSSFSHETGINGSRRCALYPPASDSAPFYGYSKLWLQGSEENRNRR